MSTQAVGANISSNILFHFTRSLDNILNILGNGFSPRYCPEYSPGEHTIDKRISPDFAKPMICFCDLPLSLIKRQLMEYGKFGIGLEKDWGIRNGVSPVLYYHETSHSLHSIVSLSAMVREKESSDNKTPMFDEVFRFLTFSKPYNGPAWRYGEFEESVTFYDEREWRYVPTQKSTPLLIHHAEYANLKAKESVELKAAKDDTLLVTPDDIQYILLPDDSFLDPMIDELEKRYLRKDVRILTTCIMTCDRIMADI